MKRKPKKTRPVRRPTELTDRDQWVLSDEGRPFDPNKPEHMAKTNDSSTWGTYAKAIEAKKQHVAFVFSEDDPYVGIDLDACRDPETGEITDWAIEIVDLCDSYTEVSPSGTGLHIVVEAEWTDDKAKRTKKLPDVERFGEKQPEVMACGRNSALTITGRIFEKHATIKKRDAALRTLFERYYSSKRAVMPDGELVDRLLTSGEGTVDRSADDFRLCCEAITRRWSKVKTWDSVRNRSKFAERGWEYFDQTWRAAERATASNGSSDTMDRNAMAEAFLAVEQPTLRYWRGDHYVWREGAYRLLPSSDLQSRVTRFATEQLGRSEAKRVTRTFVLDTINIINSQCLLDSNREIPFWIDSRPSPAAEECFPTQAGVLHVKTGEMTAPTEQFFTTGIADYRFDPNAKAPLWEQFLDSLWPDDSAAIKTLQEFIGYTLLPDTQLQKMLMLIGPTRSGKGTITRIWSALLGRERVANPTLKSLAGDFGLQPLLGKTLAIIPDARLSKRSDQSAIAEHILSVVGEDAIVVNRKNKEAITTQLRARFVLSGNEMPALEDRASAMLARMVVLRLHNSWIGKEDSQLTAKLLRELPGILNWATRGRERLEKRGRFVQPQSGNPAIEEFMRVSNPVRTFVESECEVHPAAHAAKAKIFESYRDWCERHGIGTLAQAHFGSQLHSEFPGISSGQRRINGKREWCYVGIRSKS